MRRQEERNDAVAATCVKGIKTKRTSGTVICAMSEPRARSWILITMQTLIETRLWMPILRTNLKTIWHLSLFLRTGFGEQSGDGEQDEAMSGGDKEEQEGSE